jgi:hypothetical protein
MNREELTNVMQQTFVSFHNVYVIERTCGQIRTSDLKSNVSVGLQPRKPRKDSVLHQIVWQRFIERLQYSFTSIS